MCGAGRVDLRRSMGALVFLVLILAIIAIPFGLFWAVSQRRVIIRVIFETVRAHPLTTATISLTSCLAFACFGVAFYRWDWQLWYPDPISLLIVGASLVATVVLFLLRQVVGAWLKDQWGELRWGSVGEMFGAVVKISCFLILTLIFLATPLTLACIEMVRVFPVVKEFAFHSWLPRSPSKRAAPESPYVKGKVLTVNGISGRLSPLMFALPDDLMARKPSEVGTIVVLTRGDITVGYYSGGAGPAITPYVKVQIIDHLTSTLLAERSFLGGAPDSQIAIGFEGKGSPSGTLPQESEVIRYITGLPRSR